MKNSRIIILFLFVIFGIVLFPFIFTGVSTTNYSLIIKPIIWIVAVLISLKINEKKNPSRKTKEILKSIFILVLIYIIVYYFLGLVFGYLKTPYSHTLFGLTKNIFSILLIVVLQEIVRNVLVKNSSKNMMIYFAISLLLFISNIDFQNFLTNFGTAENTFKYVSSYMLPELAKSILYTYLVYNAGALASILYRAPITFCLLVVPVVPDLDWFFSSIYELIMAFVVYLVVHFGILKRNEKSTKRDVRKQNPIKMIPFIFVLIIAISFVAGLFKYMPVAVLSNSMYPTFSRGDVVVIQKINDENISDIQIGDIIEYELDGKFVIHRVTQIIDKNNHTYITKGDNNNAEDTKSVKSDQVNGIVKMIVPYVGYPSVWFSSLLSISPPDDIQT